MEVCPFSIRLRWRDYSPVGHNWSRTSMETFAVIQDPRSVLVATMDESETE